MKSIANIDIKNIHQFIVENWRNKDAISEKYRDIPQENLDDFELGCLYLLGVLDYNVENRFEKAEERYLKVFELKPEVITKDIIVSVYIDQMKCKKAINFCFSILEKFPEFKLDVYKQLVYLYQILREDEKVEEYCLKFLEINPKDELLEVITVIYENQRKPEKLSRLYLKALHAEPRDPELELNRSLRIRLRILYNCNHTPIDQYIELKLENMDLDDKIKKLEDKYEKILTEFEHFTLHQTFKPDGIGASLVNKHFNSLYN